MARTTVRCAMSDGLVDLRSDTVTQPTPAMRKAMADAVVGDDVYGEDPTVNALQDAYAARVGKPAALFVPTGTMANQLALRLLARPGTAVIAGARQHMVIYEGGAAGINAGVQFLDGRRHQRRARSRGDHAPPRRRGAPLRRAEPRVRREHAPARRRAPVHARRA